MEPAGGLKGGWRSFTTSVFGGGGGGGGAGGGGECLSVREIQRLDHSMDSFVSVEDEGPGEDVSLLENRPVDQKKLRKRSHGHTQRLRLEDSDITSSSSSSSLVPPSIERCQKNKPHPIHQHHQPHITQPNGNSSVSTIACTSSSTSLKSQSNPDGTAGGGESLWQQEEEEGWTYGTSDVDAAAATAAAAAAAAVVKSSTDVEEHSSAMQKNLGCISNRARYNSFIDGILFTKQLAAAKEPALGNLIDFDNDGLSN